MRLAHRLEDKEISDVSLCDLLVAMGERSTARLLNKSYQVDAFHDIPFGAGNSLDRKIKYIDRPALRRGDGRRVQKDRTGA